MAILFNFLVFFNIFLSNLLSIFELSIDWLLNGKLFCESYGQQGKSELSYKNAIQLTELEIDIIQKFRKLDSRDRKGYKR